MASIAYWSVTTTVPRVASFIQGALPTWHLRQDLRRRSEAPA